MNPGEFLRSIDNAEGILRAVGCSEREIAKEASDYEFFRAICRNRKSLAGNRLLLAAHAFLRANGCDDDPTPENCDALWRTFACRDREIQSPDLSKLSPAPGAFSLQALEESAFLPLSAVLEKTRTSRTPEAFEEAIRQVARGGVSVRLSDALFQKQPDLHSLSLALTSGGGDEVLLLQAVRILCSLRIPLLFFLEEEGENTIAFLTRLESLVGLSRLYLVPGERAFFRALPFLFARHCAPVSLVLEGDAIPSSIFFEYPCGAAWHLKTLS